MKFQSLFVVGWSLVRDVRGDVGEIGDVHFSSEVYHTLDHDLHNYNKNVLLYSTIILENIEHTTHVSYSFVFNP